MLHNGQHLDGLSSHEAKERLQAEGYNELPASAGKSFQKVLADVLLEPMFLMLLACGMLYIVIGSIEDALMLLGFVIVVIVITLFQEEKTQKALEALRDLSSPRALVIRDGRQQRIAGREVVRGDIVLISEGDRVPADAILLSGEHISVDESLLTGESLPVRKKISTDHDFSGHPGGDDLPMVFSGTLVVKGRGVARAVRTGPRTELGSIGRALEKLVPGDTTLQQETNVIVRNFSILSLVLCTLTAVVFGFTRNDWVNGFLAGLTLAMATLPEEFPIVLTVFLALGAWRLSSYQVLARRIPAIEMLGAATVLCVDKTGTLTENRMTVTGIVSGGNFHPVDEARRSLPEAFHEVVEYGILASPPDPFDPMEKAMKELGERALGNTEHLHRDWQLVREYPLSEKILAISHVWRSLSGTGFVIASKGAPEAIASLCHFDAVRYSLLEKEISLLAESGCRVIGVARAVFTEEALPEEVHDYRFEFLGLLGLADPVREGVRDALAECYTAGIRVVMITGDYPQTAGYIGREIGLDGAENIMTGNELDLMEDSELEKRIADIRIFARVAPAQKLRIVQALKKQGEIVAMTGDGVNDAPALKAADIGIAMGGRGTDVAREAAALVLLDDHFDSIVRAVRMGRRIYENLKKAMAFIVSVHLPIAGMSLLPVFLHWPLALLPAHILFLELIIDPSCTIVFEMEPEEREIMNRRPRKIDEPLFSRQVFSRSIVQGLSIFLLLFLVYAFMQSNGYGEYKARTVCFLGIVSGNLGLIFANRSWTKSIAAVFTTPNRALWWVCGGTIFFLLVVTFLPFFQQLFRFAPPGWGELPLVAALCISCFLIADVVKLRTISNKFVRES
ncbi:MAG: cation-translocating P-type ATPase [Chlorobiaceae bacterium]|nr:cation-translocating P-type ATPase [Chlorobiaceae bacterium]